MPVARIIVEWGVLCALVLAFVFTALGAKFAEDNGSSFTLGALLGFFLGPIGVLIAAFFLRGSDRSGRTRPHARPSRARG